MENKASEIVACGSCGARNRVTIGSSKQPVCGRCKTPLSPGTTPVVVTDGNFANITATDKPIVLDMWAAWCGPCRMIAPTIEALAREYTGRAVVGKLDVDANPQTASRFGVQSIPTILILKEGREVDRLIGLQPADAIRRRVDLHI